MINRNKQLFANIVSSIMVMLSSLLISFFLTPFIVRNMGAEAYGFFKLAQQLGSYIMLFFMLLNTMTARFFTIEYYRSGKLSLSRYYSSNFISNIILMIILFIPLLLLVLRLENLLHISPHLILDIKILFIFIMVQLLINIVFFSFFSFFFLIFILFF